MARGSNAATQEVTTDDVAVLNTDDVDTPAESDTPAETTDTKAKEPTRPPVPQGFISPVQFAKDLTKHLREKNAEQKEIPPQQIYSMIRNSGKENPFPVYSEGGRNNLIKLEEGLAWWDAKDTRVAERKANAEAKAAKKAAAAANKTETVTEAEGEPAVEAE
jgi:hypothetical protein